LSRRLGLGVATAVLVACVAGCGGSSEAGASTTGVDVPTAAPNTSSAPARAYSLAATRRCLVAAGLSVGPVGKPNPRLQALGDLAQRTSVAVRSGRNVVGLAFGNAEFLAELLAVPNDPYRIETRRNALLLYLPAARATATAVRACLRP
jgi:hypothetical protein